MDKIGSEWPTFSAGDLLVVNPDSPIGVCTLWLEKERVLQNYLQSVREKIAIIGNLYSIFGVGILIRNYLAHPSLRYLIVTGKESGAGRRTLQALGHDSSLPARLFLEPQHVHQFLSQVEILHADSPDATGLVHELYARSGRAFNPEPVVVPIPKPSTNIFPTASTGHIIRRFTIAEAYVELLKEIRRFGHMTNPDSEGQRRQELWELSVIITSQDPLDFASVPHPEFTPERMEKYCRDFWEGSEPEDVAYRYGFLMRQTFGDQVEAVVRAFQDKPETFRAIISLWDSRVDGGSITMKDPPCYITLQARIITKRLEVWAYIRTNDMYAGWTANAMMLRYWQHRFCLRLCKALEMPDLKIGDLEVQSGSAHLYERTFALVDRYLATATAHAPKFLFDPKGNFHIYAKDGEIVVEHYSPSTDLLQVFRDRSPEKLERAIAPFISQVPHALYLGRELARAAAELSK